jgi:excisionase family DNA binding protein
MHSSPDPRSSLALRPREAARLLGVSERFLWSLTKTGAIPCVRLGTGKRRTVRYPVSTINQWLEAHATEGKGTGEGVRT